MAVPQGHARSPRSTLRGRYQQQACSELFLSGSVLSPREQGWAAVVPVLLVLYRERVGYTYCHQKNTSYQVKVVVVVEGGEGLVSFSFQI